MSKVVHLLGLILALRLIQIFLPALQLPVQMAEFLIVGARIGQTVFVIWLILNLLNIVQRYLKEVVARTESKVDDQLLPIVTRTVRIIIFVGGFVQILRLFDVNVAAIIAGLSLGGLALALAAQDTVKNFIGSLMIIMDRPFQVGDFVLTDGVEGTVVEVGFRTSRIQTIDTSIISIPNGRLADSRVTNLGVRPRRIINLSLGVQYNTPPERIEAFIAGLKQIVDDHPKLSQEPVYVHLNNFAASSIDVLFRCYIEVLTFPEELAVREEVMFLILRLAKDVGVSFAFPSTSIYVESLPPSGVERKPEPKG
jgi:MscS family membrane protein